jgi:hypothetical protein
VERLLEKLFPRPEDRDEWLRTPDEMIGGETPAALLRDGRIDDVLDFAAMLYTVPSSSQFSRECGQA